MRVRLGLGIALAAAYLLSTSREAPWADGRALYEAATSLVTHGDPIVPYVWPPAGAPPGRDGHNYDIHPALPMLSQVPGAALEQLARRTRPALLGLARPLCSHFAPALFGALACLGCFGLCLHLGADPKRAGLVTVVLAFATLLWVYARSPYTEAMQAACFAGFFLQLLRTLDAPDASSARRLGLFAGLLVNVKAVFALSLLGGSVLVAWQLRSLLPRARARFIVGVATGGFPFVLLLGGYNYWRWGSPFVLGYEHHYQQLTPHVFAGLWGLFLSPGKSVFLYSPPLVLVLVALPRLVREAPTYARALLATVVPVVLAYACFRYWAGDFPWGTRHLVFALPVVLPILTLLKIPRSWPARLVALSVIGAGVWVQILGNAFFWDHYWRISIQAREAWLGKPNREGAFIRPRKTDCGDCFEDVHQLDWLPPFQPILGHAWLLRHVPAGHDWDVAERDAPWHRETTLTLDVAATYSRARVDWWGLLWLHDYPDTRGMGAVVLVFELGALAFGVSMMVDGLRRRRRPNATRSEHDQAERSGRQGHTTAHVAQRGTPKRWPVG
jgi:hypothetical protein